MRMRRAMRMRIGAGRKDKGESFGTCVCVVRGGEIHVCVVCAWLV